MKRFTSITMLLLLAVLAAPVFADTSHTVRPGFGSWWLPYNYSKHGVAFDKMFSFIFWLTTIVLVLVQVVLVYFLIKYRYSPDRAKGKFIHGNTRLEMVWTLIPAVILAVLALASKHIWERFRYAEDYEKVPQTEVLVVAEQFKWNFVYPGKDYKFGQYLDFPKPSDPKFRNMKYELAASAINKYIDKENPLGQNQNWDHDPEAVAGKDDDYSLSPGRPLILPVNTPIAIRLSSKDVIHDFFLPNFRVKLDALPGMNGRINFTALPEAQSTEDLNLDDPQVLARITAAEKDKDGGFKIWIDSNTPGAIRTGDENTPVVDINYALNGKGPAGVVTISSRAALSSDNITALKAAGIKKVTALTKSYDLVCEELCGSGHGGMSGQVYFVTLEQYRSFNEKPKVIDAANRPQTASAVVH